MERKRENKKENLTIIYLQPANVSIYFFLLCSLAHLIVCVSSLISDFLPTINKNHITFDWILQKNKQKTAPSPQQFVRYCCYNCCCCGVYVFNIKTIFLVAFIRSEEAFSKDSFSAGIFFFSSFYWLFHLNIFIFIFVMYFYL